MLLAAIEQWTLERALDKAVGMFAFALWDQQLRELTLGRDRFGEKPLYYGWTNNLFVFGSELKPLRRVPEWNPSSESRRLVIVFSAQLHTRAAFDL